MAYGPRHARLPEGHLLSVLVAAGYLIELVGYLRLESFDHGADVSGGMK